MLKTAFTFALVVATLSASNAVAQKCPSQCPSQQHQAAQEIQHKTPQMHLVSATAPAQKDIVTTAVEAGSFKTLAAALGAADLVGALQGAGPFTVFAPADEAFAALPAGTVESLLKPESKEKLQAILKYHVVSGKIMAGDVLKATEVETLQGGKAPVGLTIGGANIVKTDIECSNGVIHVIDAVILPPSN